MKAEAVYLLFRNCFPTGIAPQFENGINVGYVVFNLIIYAERETLRQHSMKLKVEGMNTGKKNERVKIGED